jgi:hypothetical protein
LLNEPDLTTITPQAINLRYEELTSLFEKEISPQDDLSSRQRDYNKMVETLNEESLRDQHSLYVSRLKKGVEKERVLLKREIKRQKEKKVTDKDSKMNKEKAIKK